MFNVNKLQRELQAAGIIFGGCNETGVVWDADGKKEIQNRPDVKAVLETHDPEPETFVDKVSLLESELVALEQKVNVLEVRLPK